MSVLQITRFLFIAHHLQSICRAYVSVTLIIFFLFLPLTVFEVWSEEVGISIMGIKHGVIDRKCSGNIIAPEWILTTAHCFHGTSPLTHFVNVYAGTKTLSPALAIKAEFWYLHENFNMDDKNRVPVYNDVAVIKLTSSATALPNTALAVLPEADEEPPPEFSNVTVAGFGIEGLDEGVSKTRNVLKKANMKVRGICEKVFPYCIRVTNLDDHPCTGDSGGPMIYNNVVVGVASVASEECSTNYGAAQYTQLSKYITWIKSKIPTLQSVKFETTDNNSKPTSTPHVHDEI